MGRITKQKKILLGALQTLTSFFDAHELAQKVESQGIGLATVYRFLKTLEGKGEVHAYLCDGRKVYSLGKKIHAHFVCKDCGERKHIKIKNVDFLSNEELGKVCHFQLDVTGVCKQCLLKKE